MKSRSCFFYINSSVLNNKEIIKIGISYLPDKRLIEFNNGLRHRFLNSYCELLKFSRSFTIQFKTRKSAYDFEKKIKNKYKEFILHRFGLEVLDISMEDIKGDVLCQ